MIRESACVTPHEPGTCLVCDWCYRRTGQIRVAVSTLKRAAALAEEQASFEVYSLIRDALAYLTPRPQ